ncbi:YgaP family membrane protein [Desulforudis sp. 1088]|uniref:YgaP family membrane protein n=1 Tax=unclassified Candidatus Desulforudis TaxID=2635950 RepID=UPI003CE54492
MRLDFTQNVGMRDQVVRVLFGAVLLVLAASGAVNPAWSAAFAVLGFYQLLTAATRYCLLFDLAGWSTWGRRRRPSHNR